VSYSSSPGLPSGSQGDGAFGLGDLNYSLFVSPAEAGKVIWGLGPSITFKSATDEQLGSGKWSAGPTVVLLSQPKPWSIGVLARHLWSFAGEDDRADVSQFLIQPFVNYNFDGGWFLFSDPTVTANWKAKSGQKWTVPIGGGFGRVFNIGQQAARQHAPGRLWERRAPGLCAEGGPEVYRPASLPEVT
jgi:hypothetical protein